MKVLVTGSTGFIGSHLVEALVTQGAEVRCLVRTTSNRQWIENLPVEFVEGDCRDRESLEMAVAGVEQVYHLAGVTRALTKESFHDGNVVGTENLVDACLSVGGTVRKFIYVSSQAAAGPSRDGVRKKESDPCQPVSLYGKSKRAGERAALSRRDGLPVVILRPSAVYGPRDKDFLFVFELLSKRIKLVLGDGEHRVSMCYVTDVVRAILLAAESGEDGDVFFVSDGSDYRAEEISDVFASALGVHARRIRVPKWLLLTIGAFSQGLASLTRRPGLLGLDKARELLQRDWTCSTAKLQTSLNFQPRVDLVEGAQLTSRWYRENHWL